MCGIAGLITKGKVENGILQAMVHSMKHRGPDDTGFFIEGNVGLGHSRLSILDPENGIQPAANEDGSLIVIFNGEIYNHRILRKEMLRKGHVLANHSDTAVLPHLYEEYGAGMFEKLNGQFAIAIWDRREQKLILTRDRLGEKPLYYYHREEVFCFASEVKAIFKSGYVNAALSPAALKQIFTYWTVSSNRSVFQDIFQVPPGCWLEYRDGEKSGNSYWELSYSPKQGDGMRGTADWAGGKEAEGKDTEAYVDEFEERMISSIDARMIADVPISFYLSGGLDSSLVTAIAAKISGRSLNTFSIGFEDPHFDESEYQEFMADYLGTRHQSVRFTADEIPGIVKDVICHTEMPILRSGVFPMYALARLVNSDGKKVVLSGEGSDELFGGYDIFREVKIGEFCRRVPDSGFRPALYKKVNTFVKGLDMQPASSLSLFYEAGGSPSPFSSHAARWRLGPYSLQFFSSEYRAAMTGYEEHRELEQALPSDFMAWTPVQRAQYLEIILFFSNYLLSSQGDRVSMASSVECRYPFLDYGLVDFSLSLPDRLKIRALNEKFLVKQLARRYLPEKILKRKKFPYRAPIRISEWLKNEYLSEMVGFGRLREFGIFNPDSVGRFLSAAVLKGMPNERDCMLFMGILTTQVLYDQFIRGDRIVVP